MVVFVKILSNSLITSKKMPLKQVSEELGVSTDTLRTWIKKAGLNPA